MDGEVRKPGAAETALQTRLMACLWLLLYGLVKTLHFLR